MSVAAWARGKLPHLAAGEESRRPVPFPTVERLAYKAVAGLPDAELNARIRAAPVRDVPLAGLVGIQRTVRPEVVRRYVADPTAPSRMNEHVPTDLPVVVRAGGVDHLHDGHHRSSAALERGDAAIAARYVDLDAGG